MSDLPDFAFLLVLYFLIFYRRWRTKGKDVLLVNTTMYIYLSFVLYFTLMPIILALPFVLDHPYVPMNMTPFIDVTYNRGDCARQIILNIIMTIPFGFLLPLINRKNLRHKDENPAPGSMIHAFLDFLRVLFFTFLLNFTIETLQPLLHSFRSSDITDLITNLLGGLIGFLLYLIFKPLTLKFLSLLKAPEPPQQS